MATTAPAEAGAGAEAGSGLWPPIRIEEDLLARIERLRTVLRATEDEAEQLRRLPAAAVDALHRADLFRQSLPPEVGGQGLGPVAEMELFEAVARLSGAAGWNLFVGSLHTALPAAYLSDQAVATLFDRPGPNVVAGMMQPVGRGRAVEGGLRISGRYSWGSGISHARWVLAGAVMDTPPADAPLAPGFRVVVVPKDQVEVLDNWHVVGVSGSGSYDYTLDDVFVPDGWWFDYAAPVPHRGGGRFHHPIPAQIGSAHIGYALGLGQRALEEIVTLARSKRRTNATATVAERGAFQRDLGAACTQLAAARHHGAAVLGRLDELTSLVESDPASFIPAPPTLIEAIRAAATHATDTSLALAQLAMRYGGGSVVRLDSPIQRVIRELLVAQSHMYVADTNYEHVGRSLLAGD